MKSKRKSSGKDMLERLRRGLEVQVNTENEVHPQHQQSNNNQSGPSLIRNAQHQQSNNNQSGPSLIPTVQPQHQQSNTNQSGPSLIPIVQPQQNVSMTSSPSHDDTFDDDDMFDPPLTSNEVQPQNQNEPLLVKVKGKNLIYVININLFGDYLVTTY
jgi:hypothetical protein